MKLIVLVSLPFYPLAISAGEREGCQVTVRENIFVGNHYRRRVAHSTRKGRFFVRYSSHWGVVNAGKPLMYTCYHRDWMYGVLATAEESVGVGVLVSQGCGR